jgi:hypothetical protein
MATFTITRRLDLPSDQVWAIVSDFTRPPSPAISIEVVDAPNSITYSMLSGAPVKDYLGTINVVAQDDATLINWDVKLIPKIPGIGWIVAMVIRKAINRFIDAIPAKLSSMLGVYKFDIIF